MTDAFSDQHILTNRGRVWANCRTNDWSALDATDYLIGERRRIIETCVSMSGSHSAFIGGAATARECWHVVDPSGVLYSIGSEHGKLFTDRKHGVPSHILDLIRAYPERVIVHVTPEP